MPRESISAKYARLIAQAQEWNRAYYDLDAPAVDDATYDALMREILAGFGGRKEPRFPSAVPNALPAPPVPAAVPAPAERHERGTLLSN